MKNVNDTIVQKLGPEGLQAKLAEYIPEVEIKRPDPNGWTTIRCPINPSAHAHNDKDPSFGLSLRHGGYKCMGCGVKGNFLRLLAALQNKDINTVAQELLQELGLDFPLSSRRNKPRRWHLTIAELLKAKMPGIPESFVKEHFRLADTTGKGVCMPTLDKTGTKIICRKYRQQIAKTKPDRRFRIESGDQQALYGTWLAQTLESDICYLVEGETDTWVLAFNEYAVIGLPGAQSMGEKHGEAFAKYLCRFKKLLVCRERDTANAGLIRSLSARLAEIGYRGELVSVTLDAEDVAASYAKDPATFRERFESSPQATVPVETMSVVERITEVRGCASATKQQRHRQIATIVIDDLACAGKFYRANQQPYVFLDHRLYHLHRDCEEMTTMLSGRYDQNSTEEEFRFLLAALQAHCFGHGREAQVYRLVHYQESLYINCFNSMMYKLDGEKIERLPNGTDGILFLGDQLAMPFEADLDETSSRKALDRFFQRISFKTGPDAVLTGDEQRTVLFVWLLSLFFDSLQVSRPILSLVGPKGSIKTSTLRRILQTIYGPKADVLAMPSEQDDFDAAIANEYLVFFDNVDTYSPWLNDRLAAVAIGHQMTRRELFTTLEQRLIEVDCFLALTSRTPQFKRDDVADRAIVLVVDRPDAFIEESILNAECQADRNALWGALLGRLNQVVGDLRTERTSQPTKFRIADWASLTLSIVAALGLGLDKWRSILNKLQTEQQAFALDGDPLLPCLEAWLANGAVTDQSYTTKELHGILQQIAEAEGLSWTYKNPVSLGNRLSHVRETLAKCLGRNIEVALGRSRTKHYRFSEIRQEM